MTLILLLPGCAGFGDGTGDEEPSLTCEEDPSMPGCFEEVVTADDCGPTQMFTGEYCRMMYRPERLDFGEDSITLVIGIEMQSLTPSFLGDAPREWMVNPGLPPGISIDPQSGVISGTPNVARDDCVYNTCCLLVGSS